MLHCASFFKSSRSRWQTRQGLLNLQDISLKVLLIGCVGIVFCPGSAMAQNFGEMVRSTEPLSPEQQRQTFQLPPGFEVQLFAAEPEIQKPMNLAFDARGRLWMTGSNDYPYPNLTETAGDCIRILEDTTGDGRADKVTTFVEGITIPIGLYPYADGVIAFAIPNITFYRDTTGDGKADRAEVLYGPFDHTRDTHGLNNAFRRGLDGWLYACHGFNNHSRVSARDGSAVDMQSGNTYRMQMDGARIEHFTHGQVNPFGMAFDPFGNLYSSDCHTKPITLLVQGGHYQSFGKPHDGLGYVPDVMEHLHGSTAIAGLCIYTGGRFPAEYENSLFVGNVMTSRVHRDTLRWEGSTPRAEEQPDFLMSSDPWFRPVDLQVGPDGALYIADFYNRIIGHYEVPLDHPGRDRHSGRIWRVVYTGDAVVRRPLPPQDLTQFSAEELVPLLAEPNLPYVYRVVEQLTDRIGPDAVPLVAAALEHSPDPQLQVHARWVLQRLGHLSLPRLQTAVEHESELVRVHAQRLLAARDEWSEGERQLVASGLQDHSPQVRRAAVMACAQHPQSAPREALLQLGRETPATDPQLRHAVKIALKQTLSLPAAFASLTNTAGKPLAAADEQLLAEVSLAVRNSDSSRFLLGVMSRIELSDAALQETVKVAARSLTPAELPQLIALVRSRFEQAVDLQLELITAVEAGLRQQRAELPPELLDWGHQMVSDSLSQRQAAEFDWTVFPLDERRAVLWDVEQRHLAGGRRNRPFLSSLRGGENGVGVLRSRTFTLPERLSFSVCGHLGFPDRAAIEQNYVTLHLAADGRELKRVLAPRNDTAQRVTWELGEFTGAPGYLQLRDGIDLNAYAWIAIGEVDPPVVRIPEVPLQTAQQRLITAARLSGRLRLEQFEKPLVELAGSAQQPVEVRYTALESLTAFRPHPLTTGLLSLFRDPELNDTQRDWTARLLVLLSTDGESLASPEESPDAWRPGRDEIVTATTFNQFQPLPELLKTLPLRLQTGFARSLISSERAAEQLLVLMEAGAISPGVLRSQVIQSQIGELRREELRSRFEQQLATLPPENDQRSQLIDQYRQSFTSATASLEQGEALFRKNCATCHALGGAGKQIGPQLDGIGNRGLDRLLEDILDPNRNVDIAFRSRTYLLEDGRVLSGLFRRHEGELTVIANTKGEELSFSTQEVEAERVSTLSIMPENWGELLPAGEFLDLLGYLMHQRTRE